MNIFEGESAQTYSFKTITWTSNSISSGGCFSYSLAACGNKYSNGRSSGSYNWNRIKLIQLTEV